MALLKMATGMKDELSRVVANLQHSTPSHHPSTSSNLIPIYQHSTTAPHTTCSEQFPNLTRIVVPSHQQQHHGNIIYPVQNYSTLHAQHPAPTYFRVPMPVIHPQEPTQPQKKRRVTRSKPTSATQGAKCAKGAKTKQEDPPSQTSSIPQPQPKDAPGEVGNNSPLYSSDYSTHPIVTFCTREKSPAQSSKQSSFVYLPPSYHNPHHHLSPHSSSCTPYATSDEDPCEKECNSKETSKSYEKSHLYSRSPATESITPAQRCLAALNTISNPKDKKQKSIRRVPIPVFPPSSSESISLAHVTVPHTIDPSITPSRVTSEHKKQNHVKFRPSTPLRDELVPSRSSPSPLNSNGQKELETNDAIPVGF